MIIIKRSTPTVSREITQHYDRKGKYSQKRTRESTILKSKVHLATSGSRVWPVTNFNAEERKLNKLRRVKSPKTQLTRSVFGMSLRHHAELYVQIWETSVISSIITSPVIILLIWLRILPCAFHE